jgi:hypothetical protein
MMHEEKPGWKKRALDELRKLSITVMYIWVLLGVFTLHREIILANYHINYSAKFGFAFINAVILAKFMWLGEILHAGKKAAGKALLYSMLWNSALFTVILMVCHLLEEALIKVWHGQSRGRELSRQRSRVRVPSSPPYSSTVCEGMMASWSSFVSLFVS